MDAAVSSFHSVRLTGHKDYPDLQQQPESLKHSL